MSGRRTDHRRTPVLAGKRMLHFMSSWLKEKNRVRGSKPLSKVKGISAFSLVLWFMTVSLLHSMTVNCFVLVALSALGKPLKNRDGALIILSAKRWMSE
jgi:hypothetical protein